MAAADHNWGTSPDASVFGSAQPDGIASPTRLATSAPFARYLYEAIYERCLFIQSGVLATDSRLNNITGTRVELPFFDIFEPGEEVVNSSATWGDNTKGYYTSQRITASTQYEPYCTRGFMHSMDDLSKYQTGEDVCLTSSACRRLTSTRPPNLSLSWKAFLRPLWLTTAWTFLKPLLAQKTTPTCSLQNVINAQYLLGERAQELKTIVVHPKVAAQLQLQGQLTFSSPAGITLQQFEWGGGGIGVSNTQLVSTTVSIDC